MTTNNMAGPWNDECGEVEHTATVLAHQAVGAMFLQPPTEFGMPINIVDAKTSRYKMNGLTKNGNQLHGMRFPIPAKPLTEDINSADQHLICWDPRERELYEVITFQNRWFMPSNLRYWATKGMTVTPEHPFPAEGLRFGQMSAMVSGGPIVPTLLTRPELDEKTGEFIDLDHAIGCSLPPQWFAARTCGPASVTGWASDTDGYVTNLAKPHIRMGQRLRLRPDVRMVGWSPLELSIARTLQKHGLVCVMSGNPNVMACKFTVEKGQFTKKDRDSMRNLGKLTMHDFECVT
mgnify:CR=1 FL=1